MDDRVLAGANIELHCEPAGRGNLANLAEWQSVRDRHGALRLAMTGPDRHGALRLAMTGPDCRGALHLSR